MSHTCHARGCEVEVPRKLFMCKKHWFKLPKAMQDAVWREYKPGQENGQASVTEEYCRVTDEAIRHLHELEAKAQAKAAADAGQLSMFETKETK